LEIGKFGNLAAIEPRLTSGQLRKAALIAATAAPLIRTLGTTYRWRVSGYENYESIVASGRQPIFAFWHGRILPATLFWKDRGIVVITSQNFDGEWIAGLIRRFGYGTARGSTSRGGARALVQLRRDLAEGKPAAFTIDGRSFRFTSKPTVSGPPAAGTRRRSPNHSAPLLWRLANPFMFPIRPRLRSKRSVSTWSGY
jgi:hypothetical protein